MSQKDWENLEEEEFMIDPEDILNLTQYFECTQVQQMLYHIIKRTQRPYIYEMRGFNGFVENDYGLVVAHSDTDAKVVWRVNSNWQGDYKFVIAFASTVGSQTANGDIRIGAWNFGEAFDPEKYIALTTFNLVCTDANIPIKVVTAQFTITELNEVLIVRWRKTNNSGSGNLYILAGALLKV